MSRVGHWAVSESVHGQVCCSITTLPLHACDHTYAAEQNGDACKHAFSILTISVGQHRIFTLVRTSSLTDGSGDFPPANFWRGVPKVGLTANVLVFGSNESIPSDLQAGLAACDGALYYVSSNTSTLTEYNPETMATTAT